MENLRQQNSLTVDPAREEQVQHLKDLFRLSYHTNLAYQETIAADAGENYDAAMDDYDCLVAVSGGNEDETELADFRAQFKALGAEAVFVQLCLDYYQDVLTELQLRQAVNQWDITTTIAYTAAVRQRTPQRKKSHHHHYAKAKNKDNWLKRSPNYYDQRLSRANDSIALNQQHIKEVQTKISALRAELSALTPGTTTPKKLTKSTLQPASVAIVLPELSK